MKSIAAVLLPVALWLLPASAQAQDTCALLFSIPQNAHFAAADHLANTYLAHGFDLEKYDSTGSLVARYSNNRLGTAGFIDASNPLKILVWYADFQTAVFLDRNMTELGRLNLAEAGFPAVRCLASAADGNLWAYDEATSHLLKLSTAGEKLTESQPLSLAFAQSFAPTCIRDDGGQAVFLSDPAQGVAVFDAFAQLDKTLPFKGVFQFEVENGTLFFLEKGGIRAENWRGLSSKKIPLPSGAQWEGAVLWISKKRLFVQTKSGVAVYRF
ncbi:MAG: hypothetical protein ACKVUS_20450 [Saprospiraceae bacterium]